MEIWKPIKSLKGLYEASSIGNIRSKDRMVKTALKGHNNTKKIKGRVLKQYNNGNGYKYVTISIDAVRGNYYVHRLVADAFMPNPDNKPQVNHINGIKSDNRIENLEWVSISENLNHAIAHGLKRTEGIKVIDIKTKMVFNTIREASDYCEISYGALKCSLRSCKGNPIEVSMTRGRIPGIGNLVYLDDFIKSKQA